MDLEALAHGSGAKLARHVRTVLKAMEQDKLVLLEELYSAQVDLGHADGELAAVQAQHHALAKHCESGSNDQEALQHQRATTIALRLQVRRLEDKLEEFEFQKSAGESSRVQELEMELSEAKKSAASARDALFQETQTLERLRASNNQQNMAIRDQSTSIKQLQHTMELERRERQNAPDDSQAKIHSLQCELAEARASLQMCWQMQREAADAEQAESEEEEMTEQSNEHLRQAMHREYEGQLQQLREALDCSQNELAEVRIQAHLSEQQLTQERIAAQDNGVLVDTLRAQLRGAEQEAEAAKQGLEGSFVGEWEALRAELVGQLHALKAENQMHRAQQAAVHSNPVSMGECGTQTDQVLPEEPASMAEEKPHDEELLGLWLTTERLRAQLHDAARKQSQEESRVFVAEEKAILTAEELEKRTFELALRKAISNMGLQLSGRAEEHSMMLASVTQWKLGMEVDSCVKLCTRLNDFKFQITEARAMEEEAEMRADAFGKWCAVVHPMMQGSEEGSFGTPECASRVLGSKTPCHKGSAAIAEESMEDVFFQDLMQLEQEKPVHKVGRFSCKEVSLTFEQQRLVMSERELSHPRVLVFD